jgi:dihydroxyacetone kinase-like protein
MEAVARTITESNGTDLKELLSKIAWAVMDCDGGSTGPLLGSLFMGMSDGVTHETDLDCAAVVAMFEAGIRKLAKQSRAVVGDKTMMDAFLPALDAMLAAAPSGDIRTVLQQAATAAAAGAEATKDFRAKFGRARNLGDRVIGHADPGAGPPRGWNVWISPSRRSSNTPIASCVPAVRCARSSHPPLTSPSRCVIPPAPPC